jgi:hypothetical protein
MAKCDINFWHSRLPLLAARRRPSAAMVRTSAIGPRISLAKMRLELQVRGISLHS